MLSVIGLLILELIIFFISVKFIGDDIMSPSIMANIMFLLSTFFVLLNAKNWEVSLSPVTVFIITSGIVLFCLTEVIIKNFIDSSENYSYEVNLELEIIPVYTSVFVLFLILDFFTLRSYLLSITGTVGIGFRDLTSAFAAYRRFSVQQLSSGDISDSGGVLGQFIKFVIAQGYVGLYILSNNLIIKRRFTISEIKPLILIVISVIPSLMSAGRNQILMMISAGLICFYILWHERNGWGFNLSWKYVRVGVLILVVGVPVFYNSLTLLGRSSNRTMLDYASAYAGGSIALFDKYIKEPIRGSVFAEETFYGVTKILKFLGIGEVSRSYNLETRTLGVGGGNVYTFFRRPLHDFGIVGMYIFVIATAIFYCYIYYGKIKNRNTPFSKKQYWILFYMYIYYGIVRFSVDTYSQSYVSAGTVIIMMIIFGIFWLFRNVRFTIGGR